jgi:purine-binding chemotaxis protein CheW
MQPAARPVERTRRYLTFRLGDEEYAVGILQVREILEYGTVTRVPTTPPFIRGVVNVRGSVVPVIDLAVKFGMTPNPVTRRSCILLIEVDIAGEPTVMGVVADSVSQVVDLLADDIEPPPAFGTRVHVDYLLGVAKLGDRFALLLDIDRILSTDELLQVSEVPEAAVSALAPVPETPANGVPEAPGAGPAEEGESAP